MEIIIGVTLLAVLVEGLVQYILGESMETRPYLKYVALILGVAVAVAYKIDIPSMVGLATDFTVVNYIISGIVIGRGSNYTNDIITSFKG